MNIWERTLNPETSTQRSKRRRLERRALALANYRAACVVAKSKGRPNPPWPFKGPPPVPTVTIQPGAFLVRTDKKGRPIRSDARMTMNADAIGRFVQFKMDGRVAA